ncbi:Vitamin B12 import ATP-binding protein BtuD [Candidatus Lokiarchaeum ossiferum]|uniref:Vitamin B12 import ATP-binding protein BtuD n=1 Tax=Candidatus Lokiarchaeum ossiferum TaxID=2951803 RepID=A0ABY6HUA0_9ARCH|nr:Vitamin B12 import ATP-binding protein BtuD [Candidatus Lokiarchaeum sp. B-35]
MNTISEICIETIDLTKQYGNVSAVDKINLKISKGKIFGFLGPNGAGKSTTIRMLSTILPPTQGTAMICGFDLQKQRDKIRKLIGVCPQDLIMYELLTARENIHLIAKMHKIPPPIYKKRTDELLTKMNLFDRADEKVKGYSGGMKRRVNILMAVIHDPEIIFFDEPSAGLDPQSRRVVWDFIKDFENKGKTVILTTHNMEEADDLSDELAIIDHGKIIAQGTPQELKGKVGEGDVIEFRLMEKELNKREQIVHFLDKQTSVLWAKELGKERISFSALNGLRKISEFYDQIDQKFKIKLRDLVIRQNTLEDVFLDLTGKELRG